ncbi:hypothetical protein FQK07_10035 [Synechococcus sp. BSF8S]|uniref:hypothetical protein n=1 Tax=Synechococcales TaxID=1890424 RepID=UPI00162894DD|nr:MULTISPECIES: hypothetical protein [unclassified Synechococcus]MBC1261595.1 hypothetical protein [Synechococcus sp. BSF8S]MBC1264524.1 hypothetical protein [Synechococcus sp. BSA11S]
MSLLFEGRPWGLAFTPPGLPRLARRWLRRGSGAASFASSAMAAIPLSCSCPIRIISVHLLDAAGEPHFMALEEALIMAANQRRVLGCQGRVQVL